MITLYTFGPAWGTPDPSPFVMKAEMLLKLAGLPYQTDTKGFGKAPKGKLPYIRDGENVIGDSTLIRLYLEKQYSIDFNRGYGARECGIGWSVEKMLEDHLYWMIVYWRWLKQENFEIGPKAFFQRAPALIRPLAEKFVLGRLRKTLHGHGIGRHSEAEMTTMAARSIDALAQVLGDNRYLLGPQVSGSDATAFAFAAGGLTSHFKSPLCDRMASHANLIAYRDRMMAEFYPDFVKQA
jgi:glutathione S-transferase